MAKQSDDSQYPEDEAQRRFEALVKAALTTQPTPLKKRPKKDRAAKEGRKR